MNIREEVYGALNRDKQLTAMLHKDRRGQCIYHMRSPDAGHYPILVYSVVSDVPALSADDGELAHRITVRIHIITKDGHSGAIEGAILRIMHELGGRRHSSIEMAEDEVFVTVIDFILTRMVPS